MAEMTQERLLAALETLHSDYRDQVAKLGNNEVYALMDELDDDRFREFLGLDVPALMAWCARNPLPAGASFGARFIHTKLASQERLVEYFRDAAEQCRSVLAKPGWKIRRPDELEKADKVRARMHEFLAQMEATGAFPPELTRAALFESQMLA